MFRGGSGGLRSNGNFGPPDRSGFNGLFWSINGINGLFWSIVESVGADLGGRGDRGSDTFVRHLFRGGSGGDRKDQTVVLVSRGDTEEGTVGVSSGLPNGLPNGLKAAFLLSSALSPRASARTMAVALCRATTARSRGLTTNAPQFA